MTTPARKQGAAKALPGRSGNWGIYAAAAGAALSMATSADASIISGSLGVTATINSAGGGTFTAQPTFSLAGVLGKDNLLLVIFRLVVLRDRTDWSLRMGREAFVPGRGFPFQSRTGLRQKIRARCPDQSRRCSRL